jgi:phage terminase large subunit-like protein
MSNNTNNDLRQITAAVRRLEQKKLTKAFDAFKLDSRPNKKQIEIFKDIGAIQYRYVVAGNQSGKSATAAREIAWLLTDTHPYWQRPADWNEEPLLILIAGQDLTMMATELWAKKLRPFLDASEWKEVKQGNTLKKVENRKTRDQIVFLSHSDGSEKNRKHMQGYTAHYVWLDEMPASLDIVEELQLRVQSKNGKLLATFTPKFRNDRIRKMVDSSSAPYSKKYQMSKFDNPIFPKEFKQAEMARLSTYSVSLRNTYLYGDWSTGDSAVYQFNYDLMTVESLPAYYNRGWRHVESVDPALKSKFGYTLWAEDPGTGIWYLINDQYITGILNPEDMVEEVSKRSSGYNIIRRISDPHEVWYIGQAGKRGIHYMTVYNKNSRKAELIKGLQSALSDGKIKIGRWCGSFIDEIQGCQWSETTDKIINSSIYHNMDCAQYFCDNVPAYDPIHQHKEWHTELREQNNKRKKMEATAKSLKSNMKVSNSTRPMRGWGRRTLQGK